MSIRYYQIAKTFTYGSMAHPTAHRCASDLACVPCDLTPDLLSFLSERFEAIDAVHMPTLVEHGLYEVTEHGYRIAHVEVRKQLLIASYERNLKILRASLIWLEMQKDPRGRVLALFNTTKVDQRARGLKYSDVVYQIVIICERGLHPEKDPIRRALLRITCNHFASKSRRP